MSDKIEYSRLLLKRTGQTGQVPTIPTGTTLNEMIPTDLFIGEMYCNTADDALWVRTDNGIYPISLSGLTATTPTLGEVLYTSNFSNGFDIVMSEGNTIVFSGLSSGTSSTFLALDASGNTITVTGSTGGTGTSGTSGISGTSGTSGTDGSSGSSGLSGTSGSSGSSGLSGTAGTDGSSGANGSSGTSGADGRSFSFQGVWNELLTYQANDLVTFTGSTYISLTTNTSKAPDANPSDWSLFAEAGSDGTNGTSGLSGVNGTNGTSGTSGVGTNGTSGTNGAAGSSGTSGTSGGGGGGGPLGCTHFAYPLATGQTYSLSLTSVYQELTMSADFANRILAWPFVPGRDINVKGLNIDFFNLNGNTAGRMKYLIYDNDDGNFLPKNLIYESTTITPAGFSVVQYSQDFTLTAGTTYWLATAFNNELSPTYNMTGIQPQGTLTIGPPNEADGHGKMYKMAVSDTISFPTIPSTWTKIPGPVNFYGSVIMYNGYWGGTNMMPQLRIKT